ncbi:unnamed protein product [Amoebophrya sp. A120]|nr:unnamed protein product [Amoebophrya sp. A120]|eukprot:GSA120T00022701001.1
MASRSHVKSSASSRLVPLAQMKSFIVLLAVGATQLRVIDCVTSPSRRRADAADVDLEPTPIGRRNLQQPPSQAGEARDQHEDGVDAPGASEPYTVENCGCVVCWGGMPVNVRCHPCMHDAMCEACALEWFRLGNTCPVCQEEVRKLRRLSRKPSAGSAVGDKKSSSRPSRSLWKKGRATDDVFTSAPGEDFFELGSTPPEQAGRAKAQTKARDAARRRNFGLNPENLRRARRKLQRVPKVLRRVSNAAKELVPTAACCVASGAAIGGLANGLLHYACGWERDAYNQDDRRAVELLVSQDLSAGSWVELPLESEEVAKYYAKDGGPLQRCPDASGVAYFDHLGRALTTGPFTPDFSRPGEHLGDFSRPEDFFGRLRRQEQALANAQPSGSANRERAKRLVEMGAWLEDGGGPPREQAENCHRQREWERMGSTLSRGAAVGAALGATAAGPLLYCYR